MPARTKGRTSSDFEYKVPDRDKLLSAVDLNGVCVYTPEELETLCEIGPKINQLPDAADRYRAGRALVDGLWPDPDEMCAKTHWIRIKKTATNLSKVGGRAILVPNFGQLRFRETIRSQEEQGKPVRVIVLKARQIGYSTYIQSYHFDHCYRNPYRSALTITHHSRSTTEMHQKVLFIHKNLWFPPPELRSSTTGGVMEFADNHSMFRLETAGNIDAGASETFQHMHCSEIPRWGNSAADVFDSAMNALSDEPGTTGFIESTARGAEGEFFEMWGQAESGRSDWAAFFAPWYWNPAYTRDLSPAERKKVRDSLTSQEQELIQLVAGRENGYQLTMGQIEWRRWVIRNKSRTVAKFRQEYPTYPQEAFLFSGMPAFNQQILMSIAGGVAKPYWRGDIFLMRTDR